MLVAVLLLCAVTASVYGEDCTGHRCDGNMTCVPFHDTCDCKEDCDDGTDEDVKLCKFNNGKNPRDCATCSMNGLGTITTVTWDKAHIEYNGMLPCEILLAETKEFSDEKATGKDGFRVVAIASLKDDKKYISTINIHLKHENGGLSRITLQEGGFVMFDGEQIDVPVMNLSKAYEPDKSLDVHIGHRSKTKTTTVDFAHKIRFMYRTEGSSDKHHVNLMVFDKSWESELDGLCGNFDGVAENDYMVEGGTERILKDREELVNTWVIGECPNIDQVYMRRHFGTW